jgi:hypothetical protein
MARNPDRGIKPKALREEKRTLKNLDKAKNKTAKVQK